MSPDLAPLNDFSQFSTRFALFKPPFRLHRASVAEQVLGGLRSFVQTATCVFLFSLDGFHDFQLLSHSLSTHHLDSHSSAGLSPFIFQRPCSACAAADNKLYAQDPLGSFCGLDDHPAFISHLLLQKLLNNYWALAAYPNLANGFEYAYDIAQGHCH